VRVSVGPPYFNPVSAIFFLPMLAVLAVGPLLRWRSDSIARVRAALLVIGGGMAATLAAALWLGMPLMSLLGMVLAVAVALGSFLPLRGRALARVPLAVWGMCVAHFGVAVGMFGIAADTAFQQERLVAVAVGGETSVGPWRARLNAVEPVAGPNWTAMQGDMEVSHAGGPWRAANPQSRNFWQPPQETSEVALITRWNGQLYVAIGQEAEDGRWQLRLWWKPFVTWIWYGGLLIALGGALALVGRVAGDLRRRFARGRVAARRAENQGKEAKA
jgi:cytochrome c-type biogenesis protein CcmF